MCHVLCFRNRSPWVCVRLLSLGMNVLVVVLLADVRRLGWEIVVVFSDKLSRVACVAFVLDVTQKNNHTWLFFFVVKVQPTLLFVLFLGCYFGLHMFVSLINICVCVILLGVILSLSLWICHCFQLVFVPCTLFVFVLLDHGFYFVALHFSSLSLLNLYLCGLFLPLLFAVVFHSFTSGLFISFVLTFAFCFVFKYLCTLGALLGVDCISTLCVVAWLFVSSLFLSTTFHLLLVVRQ